MSSVDILLVEDSPADVELTLRALRGGQLVNPVHVVGDGAEALDFLEGRGAYSERAALPLPRLILLDLKLPKVSGLEVLERVKGDARTRSTPVVVLTSSREEPDIARAYALGVNSYVVKPVEFDRFAAAVTQVGLYWTLLNQPPH